MTKFPDIEKALLQNFAGKLTMPTGVSALVVSDSNTGASAAVAAGKALMMVARVGGADDRITDYPVIDVEFYASTRAAAYDLAEQARQIVIQTPVRFGSVVVDNVLSSVGPRRLPWEGDTLKRLGIRFRASVRR